MKEQSDWINLKGIVAREPKALLDIVKWSPFNALIATLKLPPVALPFEARFEHTWILGPQGSGKTQLMQHLILEDIYEATSSIVVIDSQGDLIKQVASLSLLESTGTAMLIEPEGIALNPFDMKGDQAVDLLTYVFGALGEGAEMTPKQSALYRYSIRLLQEVPEATLKTFIAILQPNGLAPFYSYIPKLSEPAQLFFQNQFDDPKQFGQTKQEVAWRLMLLLENPTFERMFCAPRTKIDLFVELGRTHQRVILVDTSKQTLGSERSALLGRFFIALLLHVSQLRAGVAREGRRPVFCYIDEAQEYLQDTKVTEILDQARKMRIGMVLANQRSQQIGNANTLDALMTTSIKFVHTDNDRDTHMLSRPMKTTPEFLAGLPKQVFGLFVRGVTPEALPIEVPFLTMEGESHMSPAEYERMRARMRATYGPDPLSAKQADQEPIPDDEAPVPPTGKAKVKKPKPKPTSPEDW